MTATLPGVLSPPASLILQEPVWGADPSTLRVATGVLSPGGSGAGTGLSWAIRSLGTSPDPARRCSGALTVLIAHYRMLVAEHGTPILVWVEEPFGGGKATVHPSSQRMLGVVLAALGFVLGIEAVVALVGPQSWKRQALGAGRGHAKKPEVLAWAQGLGLDEDCSHCRGVVQDGEPGGCRRQGAAHDMADALGIATAAGVSLQREAT